MNKLGLVSVSGTRTGLALLRGTGQDAIDFGKKKPGGLCGFGLGSSKLKNTLPVVVNKKNERNILLFFQPAQNFPILSIPSSTNFLHGS